jgi:peptidyl-prolyl cis-trans isomerase SurA
MLRILQYLIIGWVSLSTLVHAEIIDRIVAIVNGDAVTLTELNTVFEPYRIKIEESYRGEGKEKIIAAHRSQLLNKLIDTMLIDQEAKKSGITVRDEDVTATINNILSQKKYTMDDLLKELAKENSTLEAYKKDIKENILRTKLLRREIRAKITVSEEEIGEYYRNHRDSYEGKEAVRIKQILLIFPKNSDEKIKVKLRAEMDAILTQLRKGESFDLLASRHSQGPAAATGGDIGYVEKGSMQSVVESAAFSLKKDEVSGVIESSVGLHIIKVIDNRGTGIKTIEFVRQEIKGKIEEEKLEKKYTEWITELRKKSLIEIKL